MVGLFWLLGGLGAVSGWSSRVTAADISATGTLPTSGAVRPPRSFTHISN